MFSTHHIRAFTLFCFFGAFLSVLRVFLAHSTEYFGFLWNLILALIPYFFAGIAVQKTGIIRYVSLFLWLVFFPNSLYLFTDFVHLWEFPEMLHYDIVYISVMAIGGLICGFASLDILHRFWSIHYHKRLAWIFTGFSLLIGSYGVYIGRFLRLNTWDIWRYPFVTLQEIWQMTITNGSSLLVSQSHRLAEAERYSVGIMSLSSFVILYFTFFMLLYVSLYHVKGVR